MCEDRRCHGARHDRRRDPRTSGVSPGGEQARGPRPASDARHRAAAPRLPARSIALEESAAEQEDRLLAIRAA